MGTPEQDLEAHLRELERDQEIEDEVERRLFPADKVWEQMYLVKTLEDFLEVRAEFDAVLDHVQEMFEPEPI